MTSLKSLHQDNGYKYIYSYIFYPLSIASHKKDCKAVQPQIRRHRTLRLISVNTVCMQFTSFPVKLFKNNISLKGSMDSSNL